MTVAVPGPTGPGTITMPQWHQIMELYLALPTRHKMLPIGELAGRDVDNVSDLSELEAATVILGLQALLEGP